MRYIDDLTLIDPEYEPLYCSLKEWVEDLTLPPRNGYELDLPSWLIFTPENLGINGIAPIYDNSTPLPLVLFCYDTWSGFFETTFTLNIEVNRRPILSGATSKIYHYIIENQFFNYTFDPTIFEDSDGDTLIYYAHEKGRLTMPEWMAFRADNSTFFGTAPEGEYNTTVKLWATDGKAGGATDTEIVFVT